MDCITVVTCCNNRLISWSVGILNLFSICGSNPGLQRHWLRLWRDVSPACADARNGMEAAALKFPKPQIATRSVKISCQLILKSLFASCLTVLKTSSVATSPNLLIEAVVLAPARELCSQIHLEVWIRALNRKALLTEVLVKISWGQTQLRSQTPFFLKNLPSFNQLLDDSWIERSNEYVASISYSQFFSSRVWYSRSFQCWLETKLVELWNELQAEKLSFQSPVSPAQKIGPSSKKIGAVQAGWSVLISSRVTRSSATKTHKIDKIIDRLSSMIIFTLPFRGKQQFRNQQRPQIRAGEVYGGVDVGPSEKWNLLSAEREAMEKPVFVMKNMDWNQKIAGFVVVLLFQKPVFVGFVCFLSTQFWDQWCCFSQHKGSKSWQHVLRPNHSFWIWREARDSGISRNQFQVAWFSILLGDEMLYSTPNQNEISFFKFPKDQKWVVLKN